MAIKDSSVESFLEGLASKAATPGGGSAAAVLGGLGAALTSMVCRLTLGKKKYAAVEAEITGIVGKADDLRLRLVAAIEEDVAAFNAVMAAYGLPKASQDEQETRNKRIQSALLIATQAPLDCAALCREVIDLAALVSEKGNSAVISDGGVAVLAAHAGLRSCALNVYVNARALDDMAQAGSLLARLDELLSGAAEKTEETYAAVKLALNP
jgi:formiminotetrahydrofolate cyclodeaminase